MPEIVVMMTQDEYRELFEKERHLAYECLESGEAELVKIGQVMLGRRWAVDDEENARIEAEMERMWAWLRRDLNHEIHETHEIEEKQKEEKGN